MPKRCSLQRETGEGDEGQKGRTRGNDKGDEEREEEERERGKRRKGQARDGEKENRPENQKNNQRHDALQSLIWELRLSALSAGDEKCLEILNFQSGDADNIVFNLPRNAIFKTQNPKKSFQDKWLGEIKNYSIFNSQNYIKELKLNNSFNYFNKLLILSISRDGDSYLIKTKNLNTSVIKFFKAKGLNSTFWNDL